MFENFINKLKLIFGDGTLRRRILFVLGALLVFRALAVIPIPGVNQGALDAFFANNQFFGLLNIFSGGGLANLSIVMLGVAPYITAAIIMQLMTIISPRVKAMYHEEGDAGRQKFTQYSRLLTVPLALIQAFSFLLLLQRQGIVPDLDLFSFAVNVVMVAAGSLLLMWLGELITEFGIGNGVSIIIFAGIVATIPSAASQALFTFDVAQLPLYLAFLVAAVLITLGVVVVTEAERPVPVSHTKRIRGNKVYGGVSSYLPLRVNQSGVIPIIFALSMLLFPTMIFAFLQNIDNALIQSVSAAVVGALNNSWIYGALYFILVFFFTYFYTAVTFDPDSIATSLQRSGAFIPGVRPGATTSQYLGKIITRITLFGALFLGVIAVLPIVVQGFTGIATLTIGGTALLIVVSVVLDLVRKLDAQVSLREY